MRRLLILLAATALTAPAIAQHSGHHPPGQGTKAKPKPKPAPRKPAAKAKAAPRPAPKAKAPVRRAPAKAAPKAAPKPVAEPAAPAIDPHAGHDMAPEETPAAPAPAEDPHAGHVIAPHPAPPLGPPPPAALAGPEHAADTRFNPAEMAAARDELRQEHGSIETFKFLLDQLEAKSGEGQDEYGWDAHAWYGGDINKLWLKSEGEGGFGDMLEHAEVQALWSRAIDPWFDLQLGLRHDFRPDPQRTHVVAGVQGLAPYWFEVDAAAFLSNKGDLTGRVEVEYDLRLTQKLILQPRVEFDLALQDVPEVGIGSGLSSGELGARLRYELRPEFAPYVGFEYGRAFGRTAAFRRSAGEDAGGLSFLTGLRFWF